MSNVTEKLRKFSINISVFLSDYIYKQKIKTPFVVGLYTSVGCKYVNHLCYQYWCVEYLCDKGM